MTTSAKTSRNIIPAGFKKVEFVKGSHNFDYGGGKFDKATEYLAGLGVTNWVYDPYNRSPEHNQESLDNRNRCITTTCFNVLNVIPEDVYIGNILISLSFMSTENIYIGVYEGDKSNIGKKTRDGWQNNRRLKDYLPLVSKYYPQAHISKGLIRINNSM